MHEQYQFVLTDKLQNDLVEMRLGQYGQMSDRRFSISAQGYVREKSRAYRSARMIWHQLIRHSRKTENSVLLDAESSLSDITD